MGNNNRRRSALADKDALTEAVNCSKNMKEVLERMGLRAAGGNFKQLKKYANEFGIELPKADPRDKLQAAHFKNVTPDELVFCEDSTFSNRKAIKRRLRARGYPDRCALCGLGTTWNGQPITLQLDHINGRSNDNRIENLRLLCPNCHAQTETFRGYNIKPRKHCKCGVRLPSFSGHPI
ncbi:HNH endonuclease, partial [Corynebacterium sp. HMSC065A05]|uniref:HNH endonuclease n=1 Tax=Corynebacterium sp. HMSC065A05 TaxID=1739502 RepID=UPI00114CDD3D